MMIDYYRIHAFGFSVRYFFACTHATIKRNTKLNAFINTLINQLFVYAKPARVSVWYDTFEMFVSQSIKQIIEYDGGGNTVRIVITVDDCFLIFSNGLEYALCRRIDIFQQ